MYPESYPEDVAYPNLFTVKGPFRIPSITRIQESTMKSSCVGGARGAYLAHGLHTTCRKTNRRLTDKSHWCISKPQGVCEETYWHIIICTTWPRSLGHMISLMIPSNYLSPQTTWGTYGYMARENLPDSRMGTLGRRSWSWMVTEVWGLNMESKPITMRMIFVNYL